ncbi:MAG: hypothetical protein AB7W16_26785 [Candidatus Obscuribacterales bacterium]
MIETETADPDEKPTARRLSFLGVAVVSLVVLIRFWQTVFAGASISRVDMIPLWDSLYHGFKSSPPVGIEEGSILFMAPYHLMAAALWRAGEIPLWNPFSGLGSPLLADPQAAVLSPLYLPLLLWPDVHGYNLVLVLQLLVLAGGAFILARSLGLGVPAAMLASLGLAFCPYNQWYLELLGSGYCLYPFLFWAFIRLALGPGFKNAVLVALMSALLVVSGHPEISIAGLSMASLLYFFLLPDRQHLRSAAGWFLLSGLLGAFLAAPVLLPFLELVTNSESYKFTVVGTAYMKWDSLLLNLAQPGFSGASPFLGPVLLAFLPLSVFLFAEKKWRAVIGTSIAAVFIACKLPPLEELFYHQPFNALVPSYFVPVLLLLLCLLGAAGFDALMAGRLKLRLALPSVVLACLAIAAVRPALIASGLSPLVFRCDLATPGLELTRIDWMVLIGACSAISISLAGMASYRRVLPLVSVFLVVLNTGTQMLPSACALPVRENFDFPLVEPLPKIKASGARMMALGPHLFKPNQNIVNGVFDLRFLNALFPDRFVSFARAAGANIEKFKVDCSLPLSPLLDLAGVRWILSERPIYSDSPAGEKMNPQRAEPILVGTIAKVSDISWRYHPGERAIFGRISFERLEKDNDFLIQFVLLGEDGGALWWDDSRPGGSENSMLFSVGLPEPGREVRVGIQFRDPLTLKALPVTTGLECQDDVVVLARVNTIAGTGSDTTDRYKLVDVDRHNLRLYENIRTCPSAFLAARAVAAGSSEEALDLIEKPGFDWRHEVILEEGESGVKETLESLGAKREDAVPLSLVRKSPGSIAVTLDPGRSGIAVVPDIYYPGWIARIDGKRVPLMHGNYFGRAVFVPSGSRLLTMDYEPLSFPVGIACFIAALAAIISINASRIRQ